MNIDPGTFTLIQTTFLQHISAATTVVTRYALNLIYLFAVLELALFGLLWSLQQNPLWERFFFKVFKIGLIFFIIQSYPWLIDSVIRSFAILGGAVADTKNLSQFIFNPAKLWQYGYDLSLVLLKAASLGSGIGFVLLQLFLGFGLLLTFGLLGIQIVLQMVGFYLLALIALILFPFGVFNPAATFLTQAGRTVFQAGVRVMTLIVVIGIAVAVFNSIQPIELATAGGTNTTDASNISQLLGLFFCSLLFLYLAIYLPRLASEAVGSFSMRLGEEAGAGRGALAAPAVVSAAVTPAAPALATMQAATSIDVTGRGGFVPTQTGGVAATEAAVSRVALSAAGAAGAFGAGGVTVKPVSIESRERAAGRGEGLGGRAPKAQSISAETLKKLEQTLQQILQKED